MSIGTSTPQNTRSGSVFAPADSSAGVNEAVLFAFDDILIPFTRNLQLTMSEPQKYEGNPVAGKGAEGTPDSFGLQFYGSIVLDDGKYRMWYIAVDENLNSDNPVEQVLSVRPAYAESDDGINWRKPDLGLVEFRGSTQNNLVSIEPAPLGAINVKVILDADDPDPSRRYKMVAHTWWWENENRGRGTLCPLVSADGYTWRIAIDARPVNGCLPKDATAIPHHHFEAAGGLYSWKGFYYATGQSGPPARHGGRPYSGREVVLHRSPDFVNWSDTTSMAFIREGQFRSFRYGEGEESHEGVSVWNRGNVLLGLYGIWHGAVDWAGRSIDLGFLVSNNGLRFREPVTEHVFLERGADGEWDQGGLIQGQGFENVGDKTYIWYGAWDPRAFAPYKPRGGLGLAILDIDRFGYLSALREESNSEDPALVTNAILLQNRARMKLNVDGLGNGGFLRVEILDELERPIDGLSGASAARVDESGYRIPVRWNGSSDIEVAGKRIKLRISFCNDPDGEIKLFALYLCGISN